MHLLNPLKHNYEAPDFSLIFEKTFSGFSLSIYAKVGFADKVFLVGDSCGVIFDTEFAVQQNESMDDLIERCIVTTQNAFASQAVMEKHSQLQSTEKGNPTWLMNQ